MRRVLVSLLEEGRPGKDAARQWTDISNIKGLIMESSERPKPPEDPRVRFAGERTLLAWIRTGLAMMGFGFVVARFGLFLREIALAENARPVVSTGVSLWIGLCLVILGVFVTSLAGLQHGRFLRRLNRGEPYEAPGWSLGIVISIVMAVLGIAMTIYLMMIGSH
jgi:putative membrane protein